jgi:L-asparaginase II
VAAERAGSGDPLAVVATRGGFEESRHAVHALICDASGATVCAHGCADLPVFARSAIKPLQAQAVLRAGAFDAFGFADDEIALACASHGGERAHVEVARRALARSGASEADLACGAQEPMHAPAARALAAAGLAPGRVHNNCSGKHAAMIALARHVGAPVEGYETPGHPAQRRMADEVARWTGVPAGRLETATAGCGAVTFRLPLHALARAFARWGAAEGSARIRAAAAAHPHLLAGTGRLCSAIARSDGGRVLAKVGAEGVYCASVPDLGLGLALKAMDGSRRAAEAALLALLVTYGAVGEEAAEALAAVACPPIRDTRGDVVGAVRVAWAGEREAR